VIGIESSIGVKTVVVVEIELSSWVSIYPELVPVI